MRIHNKDKHRNKTLVIRLLREKHNRTLNLVLTQKRSKGTSRLDSFGVISRQRCYSFFKVNILKFYKYLLINHVYISAEVLQRLNLEIPFFHRNKKRKVIEKCA